MMSDKIYPYMLGIRGGLISHFYGNSSHSYQLLLMCYFLSHHVFMLSTSGTDGKFQWCFRLGFVKRFHNAFFTATPRLRISANSFWACFSNSRFRSIGSLETSDKFFSCFFFEFNHILLSFSFCKYNSLR